MKNFRLVKYNKILKYKKCPRKNKITNNERNDLIKMKTKKIFFPLFTKTYD